MTRLHRIAHALSTSVQSIGRAVTRGFDALVGPVGRLNDRVEAHLEKRTRLLRAHYAGSVEATRRRTSYERH